MTPALKSILKHSIFFLIAAILVWLAVRNISATDRAAAFAALQKISLIKALGIVLIMILSHYIRAYRWNSLLEPLGYKISTKNAFFSVMSGYLVNFAIPRAGEITRCTVIAKYEKVPFQTAFGTVILERIIDFFLLLIFSFTAFFLQFERINILFQKYIAGPLLQKWENLTQQPLHMMVLGIFVLVTIGLFFVFRSTINGIFKTKFGAIIKGFLEGLSAIKTVKQPFIFVALSIGIWLCYFFGMYFSMFLFDDVRVDMSQMLVTYIFGTVGIILTPGGLGAFQLIVQESLMFFNVNKAAAFAFAWGNWLLQFIMILVLGGLSFLLLPLLNKEPKKDAEELS